MKRNNLTYEDLKQIAESISAFLVLVLPVYLVENYSNTGDSVKLCEYIRKNMRPGETLYPIDIVEKMFDVYTNPDPNHF